MTEPLMTVLNFSGGKQSSALLWMVLLKKIERPDPFIVLNADPGMENSETYKYVQAMFEECERQGIECHTVPGPNLYKDLLGLKDTDKTRLDNPPYWTKDPETGKRGRLLQGCTKHYKIAPMDRFLRQILEERFGISSKSKRLPAECVVKWIGFSFSEVPRMKPSDRKYIRFEYPLIDMRMTNADVIEFFKKHNLRLPPRSVCNACFANGLDTFRDMHDKRPEDWEQAVRIDRSVRDWSQIGVQQETFVSSTLIPLEELAKNNFRIGDGEDEDKWSCDSGYCFT